MGSEVLDAASRDDVRTFLSLTDASLRYLTKNVCFVGKAADLATLAERLESCHEEEFGMSPLFCPDLIDETCQRGIFPLAIPIGGGHYLYAPKLHIQRSLTQLLPPVRGFPISSNEGEGEFTTARLGVSKRYLREQNNVTRAASFDVFINRMEDLAPVLALIRAQHGENWLCRALRVCFVNMFANRSRYRTKVIVIAVRRHRYDARGDAKVENTTHGALIPTDGAPVDEGDLVAGELGFIVGDTYCSATGAYSASGAGTLQLAVTGAAMRSVGCSVWDLGMMMEYKNHFLGCVPLPRKEWIKFVQDHTRDKSVPENIARLLSERYSSGVPVRELLRA
ncbi:hypothetical protein DQ04_02021130 [Trypanosoma grayi]|uniref:hypothetical protein n=1 Tax=Trypanosoma grayi TaxID=71804 RepID=UPI0004F412FB|nr:hypothetical protein DQ04_02021130 [Trypanosoma grayi]KEG12087.1 hypothetical protein DQ04_02021130 [Trypanosoma grayi]